MADYIYKDGELMHYGVPGMRWGVRKARPTSSGIRWPFKRKEQANAKDQPEKPGLFKRKKKISEMTDDEIKAKLARIDLENRLKETLKNQKANSNPNPPAKKKNVTYKKLSELTNEELQTKIDRMALEKRYRDLAKEVNPPKSTRGRDFVLRVVEKIGENTIVNLGTQAINHGVGVAINNAFGVKSNDTQNRIVNPQKGQSDKK